MNTPPDTPNGSSDLEDTRAALEPTLAQTAAILPWIKKPQPARFSPELNERWSDACRALAEAWAGRHQSGLSSIRSPIYALLAAALDSREPDFLQLAEALASVADRAEDGALTARTVAAMTSLIECLLEPGALENSALPGRARLYAGRLEQQLQPSHKPGDRSDVLDGLFVRDSLERLDRMREALDVLPLDIYALKTESHELVQQAEQIDLWGIVHLGRQLENFVQLMDEADEAGQDRARDDIAAQLHALEAALSVIDY